MWKHHTHCRSITHTAEASHTLQKHHTLCRSITHTAEASRTAEASDTAEASHIAQRTGRTNPATQPEVHMCQKRPNIQVKETC